MPDKFRSTLKDNRSRADAVEAENPLAFCIIDGEKRFGPALNMALACMTAQERIQNSVSAIKVVPIMGSGNRLFMPGWNRHVRSGKV